MLEDLIDVSFLPSAKSKDSSACDTALYSFVLPYRSYCMYCKLKMITG